MAHTARDVEGTREFFDFPEELATKAKQLAAWIRASKHFIAFTGAGISTACGIPDFRSGMDTCRETGAGAWELKAKNVSRPATARTTTTLKAIPSFSHMCLVKLREEGRLRYLVSQNTDGLHRQSGIPRAGMSELHGNQNLERCSACGFEFLRDFHTRNDAFIASSEPVKRGEVKPTFFHATGRRCAWCGGMLQDSIVNFGENLPEDHLESTLRNAARADLCLSLGSSLTVYPANQIPEIAKDRTELSVNPSGGRLVICNLQRTPLDPLYDLRIFAKCDDLMSLVMQELSLVLEEFRVRRRLGMRVDLAELEQECRLGRTLRLRGLDPSADLPLHFVRTAVLETNSTDSTSSVSAAATPLSGGEAEASGSAGEWRGFLPMKANEDFIAQENLQVRLGFFGHYGEPDLVVPLPEHLLGDPCGPEEISRSSSIRNGVPGKWGEKQTDRARRLIYGAEASRDVMRRQILLR